MERRWYIIKIGNFVVKGGLEMARHGKLSGSPFHIEDVFYKYAVEKENDDYRFTHEKTQCPYIKIKGNVCGLFNSGHKICAVHKCRFFQQSQRRSQTCDQCAYFYGGHCVHKKGQRTDDPTIASYCCFFDDDPQKVKQVQSSIWIAVLRNEVEICNATIKRSEKYIRKAEKELASNKVSAEDRVYLKNKISARYDRIRQFEKRRAVLAQKLMAAEKERKRGL